jgi:hypothetical protein
VLFFFWFFVFDFLHVSCSRKGVVAQQHLGSTPERETNTDENKQMSSPISKERRKKERKQDVFSDQFKDPTQLLSEEPLVVLESPKSHSLAV